jgi:hypothetical protein
MLDWMPEHCSRKRSFLTPNGDLSQLPSRKDAQTRGLGYSWKLEPLDRPCRARPGGSQSAIVGPDPCNSHRQTFGTCVRAKRALNPDRAAHSCFCFIVTRVALWFDGKGRLSDLRLVRVVSAASSGLAGRVRWQSIDLVRESFVSHRDHGNSGRDCGLFWSSPQGAHKARFGCLASARAIFWKLTINDGSCAFVYGPVSKSGRLRLGEVEAGLSWRGELIPTDRVSHALVPKRVGQAVARSGFV